MADGGGARIIGIVHIVIDAGDRNRLWRLPVGRGKGQRAGNCRGALIRTLRGDGDRTAGLTVEADAVGGGAAGFGDLHRGVRESHADAVIIGDRHSHIGRHNPVIAAAGNPVAEGGGACIIGIVQVVIDTGDRNRLWRLPVGRGKGQRAGNCRGALIRTLRGDGDRTAGLTVEADAVGGGATGFGDRHRGVREGHADAVILGM